MATQSTPFWKATWFKVVAGLVVLVLVFGAGKMFERRSSYSTAGYYDPYAYYDDGYGTSDSRDFSVQGIFNELESSVKSMSAGDYAYPESAPTVSYFEEGSAIPDESVSEQKIIKTGSLTIDVKSTEETIANIAQVATKYNGFVQDSQTWLEYDETTSGSITFRVEAAHFESAMAEVKEFATVVQSESISGQDVTEEFVDLEARLGNLRAEEQQYLDILAKAVTVEELLMTSDYLSTVRGEIETIEGRLKYLSDRTDLSTISVWIYEEASIIAPTSDWQPVVIAKEAVNQLVVALQSLAEFAIQFVVIVLPLALIVVVVIWIVFAVTKRFSRRHRK